MLACWLGACGGDLTGLEGVYRVTAATENLTGCDTDGDSVLDGQAPFVFVEAQAFLTDEFVAVVECEDVAACQAAAATDTVTLDRIFDEGSDADGWTSRLVFTSGAAGVCAGTVTDLTLQRGEGDGDIRVEARHTDVAFDDPDCTTAAAEAAAVGQACTRLDTLSATFEATL
jgi:hypothetical protein